MKKSREDRAEILTNFILSVFVGFLVTWILSGFVKMFLPTRFTALIFRSPWIIWVIGLCIVVIIFVGALSDQKMQHYWNRACTGFQWRRRFPDASKNDIRDFLELFVNAFAFRRSRRLCFSPDDKIIEIYRTLYPGWILTDMEELEILVSHLHEKYGIDATTFWKEDITLGELFAHTRVI